MSDLNSVTAITSPAAREGGMPAERQLNILVEEEARHNDRKHKKLICTAAATGNWAKVSSCDKTHPNWITTPLTMEGDTALHIAVRMQQIKFVKKLVERTSKKDMEILRTDGNTAFCLAAISGNVKIATILFDKNEELLWIKGQEEKLPIQLASSAGQRSMVEFLFGMIQDDMLINLQFQDITKLFFLALNNKIYTVSKSLLENNPKLACIENEDGITALQLLAQSSIHKHPHGPEEFLKLLFNIIEEKEDQLVQSIKTSKAMFDAAKSGNTTILKLIFNYNPNLFLEINSEGQSLLDIAISYRKGDVYRLIFEKGSYKNVLVQRIDKKGNNVLHLAGMFAVEDRFGSPTHQALICSEELWFKEVEKIVPPSFKSMKNREGMTPKELFYYTHKRSSEKAIEEVNGISNTFIVVATLIISLGISGALTVRTNPSISSKSILFCDQNIWYMIVILSIGVGVSFSAASVLLFTSVILPSTWRLKGGYVYSRITRMTFAYLFSYLSALVMGLLSTLGGVILVYNFLPGWVFIVIALFCVLPMFTFVSCSYYSLYVSCRLLLVFAKELVAMVLSKMGIVYHWPLFYLE